MIAESSTVFFDCKHSQNNQNTKKKRPFFVVLTIDANEEFINMAAMT